MKSPMIRVVRDVPVVAAVLAAWMAGACRRDNAPQAPSIGSAGPPVRVTGSEKIAWDQAAGNATQLARYRFIVYIDDMPAELSGVSCTNTVSPNGTFPCTALLPKMAPGRHRLQLAAAEAEGDHERSPRSGVLLLDVAPRGPS